MLQSPYNLMLISVIIPTYNRPQFLKEAIASVLAQTYPDFEIIVVDDGSTLEDRSQMFKSEMYDKRVRYFYCSHQGVSAARNYGVSQARGQYLAFLDSDDVWVKDKLEKQLAFLKVNPTYQICYTNEKWLRNGQYLNQMEKHRKYGGWIFEKCLPLCIISASSILFAKEVFEKLGGFDEKMPVCEDYDLWLRITLKYPVGFLDEALIIKRGGHPEQLSKKYWGMDRFRVDALEKILRKETLTRLQFEQVKKELDFKYHILLIGARKRRRFFFWLAWRWRQIRQKWKRRKHPILPD